MDKLTCIVEGLQYRSVPFRLCQVTGGSAGRVLNVDSGSALQQGPDRYMLPRGDCLVKRRGALEIRSVYIRSSGKKHVDSRDIAQRSHPMQRRLPSGSATRDAHYLNSAEFGQRSGVI
nr:hypothetical protein [Hydrogenophaga taeniospiralis]